MNLTSDLPFWTVKNGLMHVYPPLEDDVRCDALVVGGGISGALLARELVRQGVDCIVIERRDIGHGSTSASTALLQYEIDTPLHKLRTQVGSKAADRAYRMGIDSIHRLQRLAGDSCGFALRPSLQIAARKSHLPALRKEYEARRSLGISVVLRDERELRHAGIRGVGALRSAVAAEVDPYRLTHRLFRLARQTGLRVYDRTAALSYQTSGKHVVVGTDRGKRVRCKAVFFATGYETRDILPKDLVTLRSTYALVSEPLADLRWWKNRALIWGTGDPYLYMRTTSDKRVLVGGEDDGVLSPKRRDSRIENKAARLIKKFHAVFPDVRLETGFSWAGTFAGTRDGLGYIGCHPSFPRAYFALGFGGNGITFSEIASQILPDLFLGRANADAQVFSFNR